MKFRKKPVIREATQWFKNGDHPLDGDGIEGKIVRFFNNPDISGTSVCNKCTQPMQKHGWIDTLQAGHRVCPGDYIITEIDKEHYPCKPNVFEETYELVK